MKNPYQAILNSPFQKCFSVAIVSLAVVGIQINNPVAAQDILFDFNSAPAFTPFPIDQTAGGITAHFAGTGESYSIQDAATMGFAPAGFTGNCIYPGSVFLADLLISFDQDITDFSILYACQELGCDDAATMRVTAFKNGVFTGTATATAASPGTWPSETLSFNNAAGFDSVVVHYESAPPTCGDYGVIFMADNMRVTALEVVSTEDISAYTTLSIAPDPVVQFAELSVSLLQGDNISIRLYDISGRYIADLYNGYLPAGNNRLRIDFSNLIPGAGIFVVDVTGDHGSVSEKIVKMQKSILAGQVI